MEIHQIVPSLLAGDAIGNEMLGLKRLLISWGHVSEIYSASIHPQLEHEGRLLRDFKPVKDSITIYHYAMAYEPASKAFLESPGKRILVYHNITPHHFFTQHDEEIYWATKKGRAGLGDFKNSVHLALGDSAYNCSELAEVGYRQPQVLPILFDSQEFTAVRPNPVTMGQLDDGWTNFLFVGRVVPNKCQNDVIRVFAHYNRYINRRSRLMLVGSHRSESYAAMLRQAVRHLEIEDHVLLLGGVNFPDLLAHYHMAHVFICMSEHEGFCVPLLEAMYHGVPIISYSIPGVAETMGRAGLLVTEKDYPVIAELAHLLTSDRGYVIAW
jgi:glycosyltransferase involved in cell wall biosynthesis